MIKCTDLGNKQKEYVNRALDFVKLYAPYRPVITSIEFNNKTRKVEIYFESLFSDCLKIPYKDFEDMELGLCRQALKRMGISTKELTECNIAEAKNYIAKKECEYEPAREYTHLGY